MTKAKIYYAQVDDSWTKQEKLGHLEKLVHIGNVQFRKIVPDSKNTWLTEGLEDDFSNHFSLGSKERDDSCSIFYSYSNGIKSNNDAYVFNFNIENLKTRAKKMIEDYNLNFDRFARANESREVESVIEVNENILKWIRYTKRSLLRGKTVNFNDSKFRISYYRPFTKQYYYFERIFNEEIYQFPQIFPNTKTESENCLICLPGIGNRKEFGVLVSKLIISLDFAFEKSQCFAFYTYDIDENNRQENITDWALEQFQTHYQDPKITKWDIFHYTYALLHHPHYRQRYAANLKRELPRIPFAPEFHPFAIAGKRLTEIHINYEQQPEYRLKHIENKDLPIDWRVEKMRLSKDKTQIKYNDFLTLTGIPPETFEYKLGNRSALDWIIDQYQVSTDKRSGITNDPNRLDDEEYIVRLIKQVITVSLETVKIVKGLPDLGLPKD